MQIQTRDFDVIEINENEIFHFEEPILGFEAFRDFILISDPDIGEAFIWLQSTENANICFITIDFKSSGISFDYHLDSAIQTKLGEGEYQTLGCLVIDQEFTQSTVNMKCPIFLNNQTHKAAQVLLNEDYPIKCKLFQGEVSC